MLYKNTSVKRVIAKVFADNDIKEGTFPVSDAIEWSAEALQKIGSFSQMIHKVTGKNDLPLIVLENYQAPIPYDFHKLVQISYGTSKNGPFYPLRSATGSFERDGGLINDLESDVDDVASTSSLVTLAMQLYDLTYPEALNLINTDSATRSLLNGLLVSDGQPTVQSTGLSNTMDYVYTINNNWIKTNVESGYLMVAYQAIPIDAEGYPLVPDDQAFLDALYWYITMKMLYPKWASGQIRDAVYYNARSSWNYYCKQAYGNSMMPDPDQMESVKNAWLRLVPNINEHDEFFSTTGEEEVVWNHNRK